MCGFLGFLGPQAKDLESKILPECLRKIKYRGPDQSGTLFLKEHNLWLGHNRLAIFDTGEASKQPLSKSRLHIIFNGELYNFLELKKELQDFGHFFTTLSDTEVALEAYRRWGGECFKRFNGFWALAIYDESEKTLILSRDRLGKKPLFLSGSKNTFIFASEMKTILPLLSKATPNRKILCHTNQMFLYEATEESLINEIKKIPAGCFAKRKNDEISIHPFWQPFNISDKTPTDYEEQVEKFRDLFLDSCQLRLRSDVPVGTALSGGLDSSCVLAATSRINSPEKSNRSRKIQTAFCMRFPNSFNDEWKHALQAAEFCGLSLQDCQISGEQALNSLPSDTYQFEEIYITSLAPMMALYKYVSQVGIKVTLDGHGADELFGGYLSDILFATVDMRSHPLRIAEISNTFNQMRGNTVSLLPQIWFGYKKLISLGKKLKKIKNIIHQDKRLSFLYQGLDLDSLNTILFERTFRSILPTLLRNYDRASMASGVEIRMPFLDYRLVEYAFSLPWTSKIRNGFSKSIVRDGLTGLLPTKILHRKQKIGFNSPFSEWMVESWREFLQDTLESQDFRESDFASLQESRELWSSVQKNEKASFEEGERLWSLLAPFFWEKYFYKTAKNL